MAILPLSATAPQSDPRLLHLSSFTAIQPDNTTLNIINSLVFQNSQQIRLLSITLGALSLTAAIGVIVCILYDAVSASRKGTSYNRR